jgi:hypothetical protein
MQPIGKFSAPGPYRAWLVNPAGVWAIAGATLSNCWGHDGATLFISREDAELVIRSHGFEPEEAVYDA